LSFCLLVPCFLVVQYLVYNNNHIAEWFQIKTANMFLTTMSFSEVYAFLFKCQRNLLVLRHWYDNYRKASYALVIFWVDYFDFIVFRCNQSICLWQPCHSLRRLLQDLSLQGNLHCSQSVCKKAWYGNSSICSRLIDN
jgi:hypothetical protein